MRLKINSSGFENLYFCSDLHLGHNKEFLWGKRGFSSPEEHDRFIWDSLSTIPTGSILINLGDSCLSSHQKANAERLQSFRLNSYFFGETITQE